MTNNSTATNQLPPPVTVPSHAQPKPQPAAVPPQTDKVPLPTPILEMHEAPYSWNCTAVSPEGFNEMFTVRAVSAEGFNSRILQMKSNLLDLGYKPATARGAAPATQAQGDGTTEAVPNCVIHNKPMSKRSKDGRSWWSCSEKLADGQWCQYRPKQ